MTRIAWEGGGEATLASLDGERAELVSTRAFPPGARARGALGDGAVLTLKVHASRRREDGAFAVSGRWLDLTREARERLARLV